MNITLTINSNKHDVECAPSESLLAVVRRLGYYGVKFGDEHGLSGADTVLLDGKPVNAGSMLAAQAEGHFVVTIEGLGEHPDQGWKKTEGLHPLQQAFVESGAIQCGYCTPAQILAAKALLDRNPNPSEEEVREAIAGVLCRCTGYLKPVQAVMKAAAVMRGEDPGSGESVRWDLGKWESQPESPTLPDDQFTNVLVKPKVVVTPETQTYQTVGKPEIKVDAIKLVQGKPAFAADMDMRGMLYARVLRSPHAHARIKKIDASKARELKGVAAVLTWQDIPRVVYSTAGQSDPIPGPLDSFSLDNKVRFVGDRVAMVAAETPEIAEKALTLIDVEYEILPAIIDSRDAMKPDAVRIHDEPEYVNFADSNPDKNLAAHIRIDIGDVEKGFAEADRIFEADYEVPKVQQAHIEPHVCVTYWDEDDRLVIRTSTQVPFHVRRHVGAGIGPAGEAHPRHQAAHRRWVRRQAGSVDGGCPRASDDRHEATGHLRVHAGGGIYRSEVKASDADQDEDRREAGRDDHSQLDVRAVRHGRVRLSRADRHRQHGSQGDGVVRWRRGVPQESQHPFLRGRGVHQHAALRAHSAATASRRDTGPSTVTSKRSRGRWASTRSSSA
jgi:putative selenate reductase molybdopterin-binding subunit